MEIVKRNPIRKPIRFRFSQVPTEFKPLSDPQERFPPPLISFWNGKGGFFFCFSLHLRETVKGSEAECLLQNGPFFPYFLEKELEEGADRQPSLLDESDRKCLFEASLRISGESLLINSFSWPCFHIFTLVFCFHSIFFVAIWKFACFLPRCFQIVRR